jgi:hypothetical protein
MERLARGKRSSLLGTFKNYGSKKLHIIGHRLKYTFLITFTIKPKKKKNSQRGQDGNNVYSINVYFLITA